MVGPVVMRAVFAPNKSLKGTAPNGAASQYRAVCVRFALRAPLSPLALRYMQHMKHLAFVLLTAMLSACERSVSHDISLSEAKSKIEKILEYKFSSPFTLIYYESIRAMDSSEKFVIQLESNSFNNLQKFMSENKKYKNDNSCFQYPESLLNEPQGFCNHYRYGTSSGSVNVNFYSPSNIVLVEIGGL